MAAPDQHRAGLLYGLGAYLLWGFLPLYFKALSALGAFEIVAHRILWSVLFLAALIALARSWPKLRAAIANPQALRILCLSALLIGGNWLLYIWAVMRGQVLETSLGYYLNPLVNVLLGVVLLKEKLTRNQGVAVGLAAIGVAILATGAGSGLWISLTLAVTFGTYGLLRKIVPVDSLEGLTIETLLLAPFAAAYIWWLGAQGAAHFPADMLTNILVALAGAMTAIPLLLFAAGARRLPYSTMGFLQYIAPTIQFLLAVFAFGEPFTRMHAICFAFIWSALALVAWDGVRTARRARSVTA